MTFYGGHVAALTVSLTAVVLLLTAAGDRWIWRPYEQLVGALGRISQSDRPGAVAALPLTRRDEVGKLARSLHQITAWAVRDQREAHLIRRTLDRRVADATRKATRQLQKLAMRDALTELGNRHFLDENLESLIQCARDSHEDVYCILIDLDNFKQVNDTLGHNAGDDLLMLVGTLIRASVRSSDYAVRLGGDEFVILMPGCNEDRAECLASHIGSLFGQHTRTTLSTPVPVSMSVGIASLRRDGARNGTHLIEIADQHLYDIKNKRPRARSVG